MTEINDAAKATAQEHSKQGTFSFLDRLNNRNYPTEDVEIYLDEAAGHLLGMLQAKRTVAIDADEAEKLDEQIEKAREIARESRYIIHMQGISSEAYDAIVTLAQEEFPIEYRETRNPLTMRTEREPVENEDRERLFRTHLWAAFTRSVEDVDGNIDDNISPEWMAHFLGHAPIIAQAKVAQGVESLRMVTDWMDEIQGEDFFPKS